MQVVPYKKVSVKHDKHVTVEVLHVLQLAPTLHETQILLDESA